MLWKKNEEKKSVLCAVSEKLWLSFSRWWIKTENVDILCELIVDQEKKNGLNCFFPSKYHFPDQYLRSHLLNTKKGFLWRHFRVIFGSSSPTFISIFCAKNFHSFLLVNSVWWRCVKVQWTVHLCKGYNL